MGKIWAFLISLASIYAILTGRSEQLLDGILSIPDEAFSFLIIVIITDFNLPYCCVFVNYIF